MQPEEFKAIQNKFEQGIEKLQRLKRCIEHIQTQTGIILRIEGIDDKAGQLSFWFSGNRYYVKVRITDRDVDNMEPGFRVPIGWLDWGLYDEKNFRDAPIQSNFYDERGVLCEQEDDEFYCNFEDCTNERIKTGILITLNKLATRSIELNNLR